MSHDDKYLKTNSVHKDDKDQAAREFRSVSEIHMGKAYIERLPASGRVVAIRK